MPSYQGKKKTPRPRNIMPKRQVEEAWTTSLYLAVFHGDNLLGLGLWSYSLVSDHCGLPPKLYPQKLSLSPSLPNFFDFSRSFYNTCLMQSKISFKGWYISWSDLCCRICQLSGFYSRRLQDNGRPLFQVLKWKTLDTFRELFARFWFIERNLIDPGDFGKSARTSCSDESPDQEISDKKQFEAIQWFAQGQGLHTYCSIHVSAVTLKPSSTFLPRALHIITASSETRLALATLLSHHGFPLLHI